MHGDGCFLKCVSESDSSHMCCIAGCCCSVFICSGAQYFAVRNTAYHLRPSDATRRSEYSSKAMKLPDNVRNMVSGHDSNYVK